ncbi:MAG: DUF3991 and TOPRIM domain-containing protein [Oscillospiraceae bacterium]|nr:DUF3991 and TOPRIM domain-containing protein [Oscillospiraceae bacterium]
MAYLTKEEIESARQPDLLNFLQRYDPGELIPVGRGAYKTKTHSSLKISNGKWCWWSQGKLGGKNALDYLVKVKNMDFVEAVQLINQQCGFSSSRSLPAADKTTPAPKSRKEEFLLPVRNSNNKRITAYLLSRGIDIEILDFCYQHGLIYEEAERHNAVFVGYDGKMAKYATLRGATTGNRFMREVSGSMKAYSFSISSEMPGAVLNVFESAIDALSYLAQLKMQEQDWRSQSVLSLGGVFVMKKDGDRRMPVALESYLSIHRDVKEIILRMDNDAVGRAAAESIRATIETLTVTIELPEQGKDYNEWLMLQKGISTTRQKAPAKAHTEPER